MTAGRPPSRAKRAVERNDKLRLLIGADLAQSLRALFGPDLERDHESIAYLLGLTTGTVTLAVTAIRPEAVTTYGSFDVSASAMALIVRAAADLGLHVVGQVHTHPGLAYHSDGDVEGARIAYTGYGSIVIPHYGSKLPSLAGAAAFMYQRDRGFVELDGPQLSIVPGAVR